MPIKSLRREELGAFLRSRRERLKPEELGIVCYGRRRTPGLRREEICDRGKVGLSWYVWLEQGREVAITPDVLLDVTHALALNDDDTRYAFQLAELQPPHRAQDITREAPDYLQAMLNCFEVTPAYVLNGRWDRIAWNHAAKVTLGSFASDTAKLRNSIWATFTNMALRESVHDWSAGAQLMLAEFHASRSRFLQEPWMQIFIRDLSAASTDFANWWPRCDIAYSRNKRITLHHRVQGDLTFFHTTFEVSPQSDLTLVVLTPDPDTPTLASVKQMISQERAAKEAV